MKIAVIGDLHLGFKFDTELGNDSFINAKRAMEKAVSLNPDLVILMGDIFDARIPKPEVLAKAIELFSWLNSQLTQKVKLIRQVKEKDYLINRDINPILAIYGTHELRHKDSINPVQLLQKARYLRLLDKESLLIEKNGHQVGIHGLSGVHDQFVKEELKAWSPEPFSNVINFLLFHQTFKDLIPQVEQALEYKDLPRGFDVVLNGHIHWQQEDCFGKLPIIYTGSTQITQLKKSECGKAKGIYLFSVEIKTVRYQFAPIEQCREAFYVEVEVSGLKPSEIIEKAVYEVESVLLKSKLAKPQVKVKLSGEIARGFLPTDVRVNEIMKKFESHAFLDVDRADLSSNELTAKAKLLGEIDKQKSIEEIGLQILCEQLSGEDKKKVVEVFEKLAGAE